MSNLNEKQQSIIILSLAIFGCSIMFLPYKLGRETKYATILKPAQFTIKYPNAYHNEDKIKKLYGDVNYERLILQSIFIFTIGTMLTISAKSKI